MVNNCYGADVAAFANLSHVCTYSDRRQYVSGSSNDSVNSKRAHPPGICRTFVILFRKSYKCLTVSGAGRSYKNPTVGLENRVQMPHPGTTPKLYFPVNKLQIPYFWEISHNVNKTREAP